uniref:Gamma-glutamyltranspeptidase 1 n=1 Tax=Acrobeloides nanus TaxID=290746 RepID=A0A914DRB7_9BILA
MQIFLILFLLIVALVVTLLLLFGAYKGIRRLIGQGDYHMSDDATRHLGYLIIIVYLAVAILEIIFLYIIYKLYLYLREYKLIESGKLDPFNAPGADVYSANWNIMMSGGNAVEAMIAGLLCIGVVNPQSSGLGGGFLMTLYNSTTQRCISVDAREVAPSASNSTMFVGRVQEAFAGYRSIAVPSELHGYWSVFQRFGSGRVTWKQLFEPSIKLARDGFPVSSNLAMILEKKESIIMNEPTLRKVFTDPRSGRVYEEGDLLQRLLLADTLEELANATDPVELFYKGGIAQTIAAEIQENGGHITAEDLANYETIFHETPLESEVLPGEIMCGPPPPSSFPVTQSIIGVMAQFYHNKGDVDLDDPLLYHRLIESEKFAYAIRTKLGDIDFVPNAKKLVYNMTKPAYVRWIASLIKNTSQPFSYYTREKTALVDDHGTSHVVVIDKEGNAVSTTSTINQHFGSQRVSPTLGIIWNDEMDDFSTPGSSNAFGFPPSPANFIEPGKRAMSSMSPTIIYSKSDGKVKMVVGGSGGSRIISAVAQTVIRAMIFNQTVKEAVDAPRLHNQYMPYVTEYETTSPEVGISRTSLLLEK